jgi:hypothetical protein
MEALHIPPDRGLEIGIAIGMWIAHRFTAASRRNQGVRLGDLEKDAADRGRQITDLEKQLAALLRPSRGSDDR